MNNSFLQPSKLGGIQIIENIAEGIYKNDVILQPTTEVGSLTNKKLKGKYLLIPVEIMLNLVKESNFNKKFRLLILGNVTDLFSSLHNLFPEFTSGFPRMNFNQKFYRVKPGLTTKASHIEKGFRTEDYYGLAWETFERYINFFFMLISSFFFELIIF